MRRLGITTQYRIGHKARERLVRGIAFALLVVLSLVIALPFLWMISTSLKPDVKAVLRYPPEWIPRPPTWRNYLTAWRVGRFSRYTFNSVVVATGAVVLQVINACLCAYVFARMNLPGKNILFLFFLAVMMIPSQVTVVPRYIILSRLRWLDTYKALIIPFAATAFGTFLIRQSFMSVPQDLVDAAIMDGASHLQILRHVLIPLSRPAIVTYSLLSFNWRWNNYFWVLIMTNSNEMRTLPVGIVFMREGPEGGSNWHILMAGTVLVLIPVLALFVAAQRYFVEGVAHTGLKGA
jgi:ABC-type glycerol-3-phosphate transport system permease component